MARPNKYEKIIKEKLESGEIEKLAMYGLTNDEIADFIRMDRSTFYVYLSKNKQLSDTLKKGKKLSDDRVEQSLYHRAIGYSHPEDKIFNNNGKPLIVPTMKHYPPDVTAQIFWLKNRRPDQWRDRQPQDTNNNELDKLIKAVKDVK